VTFSSTQDDKTVHFIDLLTLDDKTTALQKGTFFWYGLLSRRLHSVMQIVSLNYINHEARGVKL
jgi:hypothetical protein